MVGSCAAATCGNRVKKGTGISFHRFPLHKPELLAKWLSAIQRDNFVPTNYHKLCSEHFTESCYWKSQGKRLLKHGAVPTIFKFEYPSRKGRNSSRQMLKRKIDANSNDVDKWRVKNDHNSTLTENKPDTVTSELNKCTVQGGKSSRQKLKRKTDANSNEVDKFCFFKRVTNNQNDTLTENETDGVKSGLNRVKSGLNKSNSINQSKRETMSDSQDSCTGKLKLTIARLKTKGHIDKHTLGILNTNFSEDMLEAVYKACGKQNGDYSDILKMFAITIHFYCPAAYEYLRQTLDKMLPQVNIVRKWCTSSVGEPGFTEQGLKFLEERVASSSNLLYVSLMFDEMLLERGYTWDGNKFVGCVNLGDGVCVSDYEEAIEVLVLMVVAVNASWKIPIGYYLVNKLSASVKANIVSEAVLRLQSLKLNVLAVTCKGESSNLIIGEKLGCNFMAEALDCSFTVGEQSIQFMLDPFHMISLVRNLLCEFKILKDQNGNVIDCRYIELLQDQQQNEHDVFPGKTRRKSDQSLEEYLAFQVPSVSIGKALQSACTEMKLQQFEGALPTAEFCMFFDKLFAFFTSKNSLAKGYKAVLSPRNKVLSFSVLDHAESYLLGMKDKYDRPLYHTSRRIAIIGFLSLCRGIRNIYMDVIETKQMNFLATYKFTIENLELFFNRIQNKVESSHPTALQFKEEYKELVTREARGQDSESINEQNDAMES